MKITLLRHEQRPPDDPRFFTTLTSDGLHRSATSLVTELLKQQDPPIDAIYCSPFLRTVQTVAPFARHTGLPIRIEPALYEFMEDPLFTDDNWNHSWTELPPEFHALVDTTYQPVFQTDQLQFRESWPECCDRTDRLLNYLSSCSTHQHPVLVSHLSALNGCLRRWNPKVDREDWIAPGVPQTHSVTES